MYVFIHLFHFIFFVIVCCISLSCVDQLLVFVSALLFQVFFFFLFSVDIFFFVNLCFVKTSPTLHYCLLEFHVICLLSLYCLLTFFFIIDSFFYFLLTSCLVSFPLLFSGFLARVIIVGQTFIF